MGMEEWRIGNPPRPPKSTLTVGTQTVQMEIQIPTFPNTHKSFRPHNSTPHHNNNKRWSTPASTIPRGASRPACAWRGGACSTVSARPTACRTDGGWVRVYGMDDGWRCVYVYT